MSTFCIQTKDFSGRWYTLHGHTGMTHAEARASLSDILSRGPGVRDWFRIRREERPVAA